MGIYTYFLTTKSRRLKVGSERKNFYRLKYAGKETFGRSSPQVASTRSRLADLWHGKSPEYVVFGEFENGATVYKNWPGNQIEVRDSFMDRQHIAGYLRGESSRKLVFEPWNSFRVDSPQLTADQLIEQRCRVDSLLRDSGVMRGEWMVCITRPPEYGGWSTDEQRRASRSTGWEKVVLYTNNSNDSVMAKMVLAGHDLIILEA